MARKQRSSNPNPPTSSITYSPNSHPHPTPQSSIFPYSTARPPTNYSTQSWLPPSSKPIPKRKNSDPNPFGGIEEEDEGGETPLYTRDDWRESGASQSAYSRSSFAGASTAGPGPSAGFTTALGGIMEDEEDSPRHMQGGRRGMGSFAKSTRSTLPSVLDLEHLTKKGKGAKGDVRNPFEDPDPGTRMRSGYRAQHTPGLEESGGLEKGFQGVDVEKAELEPITPGAQNRLGRMSVAKPKEEGTSMGKMEEGVTDPSLGLTFWGRTKRHYKAYRLVIQTVMAFISAMLLTISLSSSGDGLGKVVGVKDGVFVVSAGGGRDVRLGVSGWCQEGDGTCRAYRDGDFANADASFTIPGSTLMSSMYNLLIALTTLTYLLLVYNLITSFFHHYLLFALSIPSHHFTDLLQNPFSDMTREEEVIQAEVDLRVRCERIPFESYLWVWWVWWGHKRGPVGGVYALGVGLLGVVTFFVAIGLERSIESHTGSKGVSLGVEAFVPLLVVLLNMDGIQQGTRWFIHFSASWATLTNPPDPSPAAIMLPPFNLPPIHKHNSHGLFYAPRTNPTHPPTLDLDPETQRWLLAYPHDVGLFPLINSLSSGKENDDFILSDMGLLYLRPEGEEAALLAPPSGEIRRELIQDAHEGEGEGGHEGLEGMIRGLGGVFWWMTMEEEVREFVGGCEVCQGGGGGGEGRERKLGMTPLPFTGVTGWTEPAGGLQTGWTEGVGESAMAADMAFAMRKAEEEARRGKM